MHSLDRRAIVSGDEGPSDRLIREVSKPLGGLFVVPTGLSKLAGKTVPKQLTQLDGQQMFVKSIKPQRVPRGGSKPELGARTRRRGAGAPARRRVVVRPLVSRGGDSGDSDPSDESDPPLVARQRRALRRGGVR